MVENTEFDQGELSDTTSDVHEDVVDLFTPTPCILFVDDDERILNMLKRSHEDSGWDVLTALSGNDGLWLLSQHHIDIVVSDAKMPGMDGVEFLGRLAKEYPDITCLLMSGYMDINDTIEAINAGHIYGYIVKPWKKEQLKQTLHEALQHKRKRDEECERLKEAQARGEKLRNEPISSIMDANIITVDMNDPVEKVQRILDLGMSCVPVIDGNKKCFGVVSATDLVRFNETGKNAKAEKAWEICSHNIVGVSSGTSIEVTCQLISEKRVRHIVVTQNDKLVGLVSSLDVLDELL